MEGSRQAKHQESEICALAKQIDGHKSPLQSRGALAHFATTSVQVRAYLNMQKKPLGWKRLVNGPVISCSPTEGQPHDQIFGARNGLRLLAGALIGMGAIDLIYRPLTRGGNTA